MLLVISFLVFLLLAASLSNIRKTYSLLPKEELRRRSIKDDQVAAILYQVVRHGWGLDIVLWFLTLLSFSLAMVMASGIFHPVVTTIIIFVTSLYLFIVSPNTKNNKISAALARRAAPWLTRLLIQLRPVLSRIISFIQKHRPITIHTGLYEKKDLVELLENQKIATNNRIEASELDIALHALSFGDKLVHDHMVPRRVIRFVSGEEAVGPVLLDELHESGFSRFPVINDEGEILGTLYLRDLMKLQGGGIVKQVMKNKVYYVNESSPLEHVLAAFLKTKHHIFMVVNEFEEIVGLITIEDVVEQILGRKIVDEFDRHDDLRAVAQSHASADRKNRSSTA